MLCLVRPVSPSFTRALTAEPPDPPLDAARAQRQHAAYVAALRDLGLEVAWVPVADDAPDSCFVEDTAVVVGDTALVTRPGAESRRVEVDPVAATLAARGLRVIRMAAPATLDGGDVLQVGAKIYVGRSARSNAAGHAALAAAFPSREVIALELPPGVLHLKSVCSALEDGTVLVAEGTLDAAIFPRSRVVPRAEGHAANLVAVLGAALVAADAPRTAALVSAAGVRPVLVDTSELRRADGALTCLSILVR